MSNKTLTIFALVLSGVFLILTLLILGLGLPDQPFSKAVAVVEVSGLIRDSRGIVRQIKKFAQEPRVKAIVLRIDSPGGVVAPMQEIFEAIKEAKREGKKVVASMGSIAASGGFYVALPCDCIVANPGTITGSIGVVMNFFVLEKFFQKLGVGFETIKSREYKDIGSPFRPMRPTERELLKGVVEDVYQEFVAAVMEERNLTWEKMREIGDGRIFSGRQAKEFGLVDTLGGLETAIKIAAQMAGIKGEPKVIRERRFLPFSLIFGRLWTRLTSPELLYLTR